MSPALNTTPLRLIAAMTPTVVRSGGRRNVSAPRKCKIGIGIHSMKSVHSPMQVVRKSAYSANGGG